MVANDVVALPFGVVMATCGVDATAVDEPDPVNVDDGDINVDDDEAGGAAAAAAVGEPLLAINFSVGPPRRDARPFVPPGGLSPLLAAVDVADNDDDDDDVEEPLAEDDEEAEETDDEVFNVWLADGFVGDNNGR